MDDLTRLRAVLRASEGSDHHGLWTDRQLQMTYDGVGMGPIREVWHSQYRLWMAVRVSIDELMHRPRTQILLPPEVQRKYTDLHVHAQHEIRTIEQREIDRGSSIG